MDTDPILREVHRMKDLFAREVGYDLAKMCERPREDAKKHPERMVQPVPKIIAKGKQRAAKDLTRADKI